MRFGYYQGLRASIALSHVAAVTAAAVKHLVQMLPTLLSKREAADSEARAGQKAVKVSAVAASAPHIGSSPINATFRFLPNVASDV